MTVRSALAALAVILMSVSIMSVSAGARVGSDAQGLGQRDAVADPAVKIFRDRGRDKYSYSYLKRHDTGLAARNRCGRLSYWNGSECLRR